MQQTWGREKISFKRGGRFAAFTRWNFSTGSRGIYFGHDKKERGGKISKKNLRGMIQLILNTTAERYLKAAGVGNKVRYVEDLGACARWGEGHRDQKKRLS